MGQPPKRTPSWWRELNQEGRDFWVYDQVEAGRTRADCAREIKVTPTAMTYRYRRAIRRRRAMGLEP